MWISEVFLSCPGRQRDEDKSVLLSDLNEAIPETELLDNSIQKGRAQLSVKTRRHRPSRSRYRDSVSSTEGDDSLDRKVGVYVRSINRFRGGAGFFHCLCVFSGQYDALRPLTFSPGHAGFLTFS